MQQWIRSSLPSATATATTMHLFVWLKARLGLGPKPTSERQRALDLIKAIDAGGLPLNPARVNEIARSLGLEVSTRADMTQTIARIRALLKS
jgi:hypothetical protein